jgi:hypothetical protein
MIDDWLALNCIVVGFANAIIMFERKLINIKELEY